VTHPDNGRFTRTIANRIWQRLMGRGVVHPVDVMANRPWNEDLLDYLAVYLSDNGYDLKKLIEHIVTSQAYQARAALIAKEQPADSYVFGGPEVKRLTAEQFLDAVWQITRTAPAKAAAPVRIPVTTRGDVLTTLQALDLSNGKILSDTLSRGAGNLLRGSAKAPPEQLIELIYRKALSRRPTEEELATAREFVGAPVTADGLADLLWVVFMLPEFQLIR
jgi:hypothetical protein